MIPKRKIKADVAAANPFPDPARYSLPPLTEEWLSRMPGSDDVALSRSPVLSGRRMWFAATLASLCLALLAAALFTPTGRAVADWVGDQLGAGHPGSQPSRIVQRFRDRRGESTSANGQPAFVLHAGLAPHGYRYEFLTFWPHLPEGSHRRNWELGKPCFELNMIGRKQLTAPNGRTYRPGSSQGQLCGALPTGALYVEPVGGNLAAGEENLYFDGRAAPEAARVEAWVNKRPVQVKLIRIPNSLVKRFHLGTPFSFFITFIKDRQGGGLTVVARNVRGNVIARRRSRIVSAKVTQENSCLLAHESLNEKIVKRETALRVVRKSCRNIPRVPDALQDPLK